jgi:hypothetical protein
MKERKMNLTNDRIVWIIKNYPGKLIIECLINNFCHRLV